MTITDRGDSSESMDSGYLLSFLLRAWAEHTTNMPQGLTWRYSLRDLGTKSQRGFADLDALFAYLERLEITVNEPGDGGESDRE